MPSLYLFPCTLGDTAPHEVLPAPNIERMRYIRHFIVEEIRTARRFLRAAIPDFPIDNCSFYPIGKHTDTTLFSTYLNPLRQGQDMGVISEAGCPAVADPGADIVGIAQREGLHVVPLVGPSSILLCMMASGFNGQSFAFHGYLPINPDERKKRLQQLERRSREENQTQLFIETPFRNKKIMNDILNTCQPKTRLCIAAGITTTNEYIHTHSISQWKKEGVPEIGKTPAIFAIHAR